MLRPRKLQPGDVIGIVSTSSPVTPDAVERMGRYFREKGYPVKVAPHALASFGFMAGTPQMRADDFNRMLHDPEVRMIVTSMGGAGAVHLVPLVDYPAIAADPKIVAGLSNPCVLMNAIGHTDDKLTLPIGCRVRLDTVQPALELLELPTC
jgi:muramoyltetrapeptide carboxypeptidase